MEGVEQGSSQLEVQESRQEQDTQPPTTPQYEDVWQVLVHLRAKGKESFADFEAGRRSHRRLHKQLLS